MKKAMKEVKEKSYQGVTESEQARLSYYHHQICDILFSDAAIYQLISLLQEAERDEAIHYLKLWDTARKAVGGELTSPWKKVTVTRQVQRFLNILEVRYSPPPKEISRLFVGRSIYTVTCAGTA